MFKWITNKVIDNYVKSKIKEIKEIDLKAKALGYINEHKEEIIEKVKDAIDKAIKALVAKIIESIENKIQEQK